MEFRRHRDAPGLTTIPIPLNPAGGGSGISADGAVRSRESSSGSPHIQGFFDSFPGCCFRNCFGTPGWRNADVGSTSGPVFQRFPLFLPVKEAQHSVFKESVAGVPKSFPREFHSPMQRGKCGSQGSVFPLECLEQERCPFPEGEKLRICPKITVEADKSRDGGCWKSLDPGGSIPAPPPPPPHPGTLGISIPPSLRAWKTILEVIPFDLLLIPDNCLQA